MVSYKILDVSEEHTAYILGANRVCQDIRMGEEQHIMSRILLLDL
jgi:hypothetical protein